MAHIKFEPTHITHPLKELKLGKETTRRKEMAHKS
jgi:hypothetical protein